MVYNQTADLQKSKSKSGKILLSIYIAVLFLAKFSPSHFFYNSPVFTTLRERFNLIPFSSVPFYFTAETTSFRLIFNVIGLNILLFIPLAFFLAKVNKKAGSFASVLTTGLCLSILFEVLQAVIGIGIADIDVVLLNLTGIILGYVIMKLIKK